MNNKMIYTKLPYVEKKLSKVVFGTIDAMSRNEDCFELLDSVYAAGINTFDTGASYGNAEASLGRWIKARNLRDDIVILTKGANSNKFRKRLTEYDILSDISDSFAKLQTNYIDIYFLHRDDISVPVGPVVELLNKLHHEGKIGAFGGSNWTLERTQAANRYAALHGLVPFTVCSPSYGLAECIGDPWGGSVTISGEKNRPFRDWLRKEKMPVFAYSSLSRGFMSGKIKSTEADRAKEILGIAADEYAYPINFEILKRVESLAVEKNVTVSQIAYSWLMHQDLNVFGITATSSVKHIQNTIDSLQLALTQQEIKWLHKEIE